MGRYTIGGENIDELVIVIISAVLNGISLAIGMIVGTRLTGDVFEKKFEKIMDESPTAKSLKKFVKKADNLLEEGKAEELIEKVTKFFDDAGGLVSSPEAKNFFKNVTELMRDLGGESKVSLKMPKKKKPQTLVGAADYKGD